MISESDPGFNHSLILRKSEKLGQKVPTFLLNLAAVNQELLLLIDNYSAAFF